MMPFFVLLNVAFCAANTYVAVQGRHPFNAVSVAVLNAVVAVFCLFVWVSE